MDAVLSQNEKGAAIRMLSQQQKELGIVKPVQVDKRSPQNGTASGNCRDGSATLQKLQRNERSPYCSEKVLAERRAQRNAKIQQALLTQRSLPQNDTTSGKVQRSRCSSCEPEDNDEVHHSKFRKYFEINYETLKKQQAERIRLQNETASKENERSPSVGKVQAKGQGASANVKGHGESAMLKGQETDLTLRTAQQKQNDTAERIQQVSDDSLEDAETLQRKEMWQKVAYRPNGNHGMWIPVTPKAKQKARMSQEDYWDMQQLRTQCERRRLEELVTGKPVQRSPNQVPVFNAAEYKNTLADLRDPRNAPPENKPSNYGEKVPIQKLSSGGFVMKRNKRSRDLAQNEQKRRSNEAVKTQQSSAVERSRDLTQALQKDANNKSPARTDEMPSQIDPTKTNNEVSAKVIEWMTQNGYEMETYERSPDEPRDSEEEELKRADQITSKVIGKLRDERKDDRKEEVLHQTITEVVKGHSTLANEQVQKGEKVTTDKSAKGREREESKETNKKKPRKFYDVRTNVPHRIDKLRSQHNSERASAF
ncbi:uncharacterized protein LOC129600515 [Paramacrobiotus metropolitanus]|uniref:uncharacterized protein LOC129600515 n=1 Tax=Paramacrobiotus metropolitanus TaxID=2943436 RepID=UPI002445D4D6|nr:uncharacterized protein LOC129600515 [Paramacrobiotus metropolitanus]